MNLVSHVGVVALCITALWTAAFLPGAAGFQPREVRVGVYQNEPKIFINEAGEASGIFIELLEQIAAQEGWTITYAPCEWADCLAALEAGEIDLMPDVAYSEERDAKFDFHNTPVIESWSRVYAAPQSQINDLSDLNGKRIAVLDGSIQQKVFEQLMSGLGYDVTLVPASSFPEAFALARDGSADAAIANHLFGDYFQREYGLTQTTIDFNPVKLYYAAEGRNADLLEAIDRNLEAWIPEPGSPYYTTLGHWEGKPAYRLPPYAGWVVGGFTGVLILAAAVIALLRHQVGMRTRHLGLASAELQESKERYRLISTVSSDYMFSTRLVDGKLVLNWAAGAFEDITGYTLDEYVAQGGWHAAVHPDDLAQDDRDMESLRAGRRVVSEIRMLTKSGSIRWVRVYAHPVLDGQNGELIEIYGAVQNITERKWAEEELRDSEQKLRAIFEQSPLGISIIDSVTGRFRVINPRYCEIAGYSESEMLERAFQDITHPDDLQDDLDGLQRMRQGQQRVFQMDKRYIRKDGSVIWVALTSVPLWETPTTAMQHLAMVEDITERKQAEWELRRRAEEFEALYDTARDLSTQRDLTVLLETIARQTARLLGASDATIYLYDAGRGELEVAAANIYSVPRGTRLPVDGGVSSEVIRTRQPKIVDDYRTWEQPRPELQHLDLRAVAIVPLMYREEIIGALGVAEIGTERKYTAADVRLLELIAAEAAIAIQNTRLHAELEAYNKELEQRVTERTSELEIAKDRAESADRVKSAFLATMSHELRTPLNSIIGFTGVLLQGLAGPLNAEQIKQMGMARDSARHLLALINDVLDISRIEAGQLEIRRAPFDMRSAIEAAMKLVLPQTQKKGLALAAVIGSNVGEIVSDQRRVEQILINLLNNAVKFTEHGEVNLECRVRDGFIETSVRDTGIGIRAEDVEKLFAAFRQIETGLNRRHEGTGLGLSICKNLVEMLGGEIHVESEWGGGSVFTFTLPLT
jgi:PAS domain S-box-containing protein